MLLDFLSKTQAAETEQDLFDLFGSHMKSIGLDHGFALGAASLGPPEMFKRRIANPVLASTYSPEWISHYTKMNYMAADPTISAALSRPSPIRWSATRSLCEEKQKTVLDEAMEVGLRDGVSVAIRLPRGTTLMVGSACGHLEPLPPHTLSLFHMLSTQIGGRWLDMISVANWTPPPLSELEADCLLFWAKGCTASEIADVLAKPTRTVQYYLKRACEKLDAGGLREAVVKAIRFGLICP